MEAPQNPDSIRVWGLYGDLDFGGVHIGDPCFEQLPGMKSPNVPKGLLPLNLNRSQGILPNDDLVTQLKIAVIL